MAGRLSGASGQAGGNPASATAVFGIPDAPFSRDCAVANRMEGSSTAIQRAEWNRLPTSVPGGIVPARGIRVVEHTMGGPLTNLEWSSRHAFAGILRRTSSWLGVAVACACLTPDHGRCEEPAKLSHYDGRLRLEYDYRSQGDASDSDFFGNWYGNALDLANGHLDFYISGRMHSDLDGSPSSEQVFSSLDDASGVIENRLLQAYADVHNRKGDMRIRLGRQYIDAVDYLHLDGGQVILFERGKLGGMACFGVPVSYYSPVSGDLVGAMSLFGRPWTGNRMSLAYAQYYDDGEGIRDQNYFFDLRQELSDATRTRARFSVINDEFQMASLDFYFFAPNGNSDLSAGCSRWGKFDARTRGYSPLYELLGAQQPYTYLYARLARSISTSLMLSPGVSFRLADDDSRDSNNRDYKDYDLTLIFEPDRAFTSSLSIHYWDVDSGDNFLGFTGELCYRHRRIWEIGLGSAYAAYTYHSYLDIPYSVTGGETTLSEDQTVTKQSPYSLTYFLRAKWNLTRKFTLRMQCDIEDNKEMSDLSFSGRASVDMVF